VYLKSVRKIVNNSDKICKRFGFLIINDINFARVGKNDNVINEVVTNYYNNKAA